MPPVPEILTQQEVNKIKRLYRSPQPHRRPPKRASDVRNVNIVRERRRAAIRKADRRRLDEFNNSLPEKLRKGQRGYMLVDWAKEQGLVPNNIESTDKKEARYLREIIYKGRAEEKEDQMNFGRARYYQLGVIVAAFITKFLPTELNIHLSLLQGISKVALELMGEEFKELWNVPCPKWHKDLLLRLGYRPLWVQGDRDLVDEDWTLRDLHALQKVVEGYSPNRIYNCDQSSVEMKDRVETKKYSRNDHVGKMAKAVRESWSVMVAANADGSHKLPLWFFTKSEKPYWLVHAMRYLNQTSKDTTDALNRTARKYVNDVFKRMAHDELEFEESYPEKLALATEAISGCTRGRKPTLERALRKLKEEMVEVQAKLTVKRAQKAELLKETKAYMRDNLSENSPYTNVLPDNIQVDMFDDDQLKLPMIMAESAHTKKLIKLISTAQTKSNASDQEKALAKAEANNDLYYRATVADANAEPFTGEREDLLNVRCVRQASAYMDTRTMCLWLMVLAKETKASNTNKVLVILDNVWFHDHARRIVEDWPELEGVRVEFLPKNSTSYTQPMDLGVIRALKSGAKKLETDMMSKMTRVDGTVGDMSQLRKLNYLDQAWKNMLEDVISKSFSESPLFYYHDEFTLPETAQKNLLAYEAEQLELEERVAAGESVPEVVEEEEPDRFTVTGTALQDSNGDTAISLSEVSEVDIAQAITSLQEGDDGEEELEDCVGGVMTGLWYFAAPPRVRPPTVLELLAGLSLGDLYEGGKETLMAEYRALMRRKRDIDVQASLIRKRHLEVARLDRIDSAKRARSAPVRQAPVPEEVAFDDYPPSDFEDPVDSAPEFGTTDSETSDEDQYDTPPTSPCSESRLQDIAPPPEEPFWYRHPTAQSQLFCFPPGSRLNCLPDGSRVVQVPGRPDGRSINPFHIPRKVAWSLSVPPGSKLFYTPGSNREVTLVPGRKGVYTLPQV